MIRNTGNNKILWTSTAFFSLVSALVGVFNADIYRKVIRSDLMPAVFGQDVITIASSIIVILLAVRIRREDSKKEIIILGILGYLFYAYGIYVIERVYNILYYFYLAVFGLSFWSIVYGVANIRLEALQKVKVNKLIRKVSAGFSILTAVVFSVLWIVQLLPLLRMGEKIEFLYSVYILDLCFIMPAFAIIGVMVVRKEVLGLLLIPSMFILGFTLIFSLTVSELSKPLYGLNVSIEGVIPSLALSTIFFILAVLYLQRLKIVYKGGKP